VFSALNVSKSAHASFTLDSHKFFSKYRFVLSGPEHQGGENSDRFMCQVYNKVVLDVSVWEPLLKNSTGLAFCL
jgi:hypothetical protein